MKKHLLVAASALVVGLSFGSYAWAGGDGGDGGNDHGKQSANSTAIALGFQFGEVEDNDADHTVGNAAAANIGGTGLFNVNVNAGANSELQGQNTLGAILNCSCSTNGNSTSLALSTQVGSVEDNSASGASARTDKEGGSESWSEYHGYSKSWHDNDTSTPVAANAALSGVTGTGMFNINVNAGANSLLQGQNTVAAIIGASSTGH